MNLYILAIVHVMFAILLCIAIPPLGISEIFTALILLCTAYAMNFCMVIFYIIFMIQDVVQYFSAIGLIVQRGDFVNCFHKGGVKDLCDPFFTTVIILFFVFSLASVTIAFFAYRVFKSMAYGQLGMQGGNNYNAFMRGANRR